MMLKAAFASLGDSFPSKVAGCCTICDNLCFEVISMQGDSDRLPGEPKELGRPIEGAVRVTFMLFDGTKTSLTFCETCASTLLRPKAYGAIWDKVVRSWQRELSGKPVTDRQPGWFKGQFSNGLLSEMGRQLWTEAVKQNG